MLACGCWHDALAELEQLRLQHLEQHEQHRPRRRAAGGRERHGCQLRQRVRHVQQLLAVQHCRRGPPAATPSAWAAAALSAVHMHARMLGTHMRSLLLRHVCAAHLRMLLSTPQPSAMAPSTHCGVPGCVETFSSPASAAAAAACACCCCSAASTGASSRSACVTSCCCATERARLACLGLSSARKASTTKPKAGLVTGLSVVAASNSTKVVSSFSRVVRDSGGVVGARSGCRTERPARCARQTAAWMQGRHAFTACITRTTTAAHSTARQHERLLTCEQAAQRGSCADAACVSQAGQGAQ